MTNTTSRLTRLTIEQEEEFLRDYFAGVPTRALVERYGVSHMYYQHLLKRRGLSARPPIRRAKPKPIKPTKVERFWARVDIQENDDSCFEWKAGRYPTGYGKVSISLLKGERYAHRIAWLLANDVDEIKPGIVIRHSCDNPPCCNPKHLIPGTQADNIRDREERGRSNHPKGISEVDKQKIKALYDQGMPGTEIALLVSVSRSTVYQWIHRLFPESDSRARHAADKAVR